jgi:hypothetical protein
VYELAGRRLMPSLVVTTGCSQLQPLLAWGAARMG